MIEGNFTDLYANTFTMGKKNIDALKNSISIFKEKEIPDVEQIFDIFINEIKKTYELNIEKDTLIEMIEDDKMYVMDDVFASDIQAVNILQQKNKEIQIDSLIDELKNNKQVDSVSNKEPDNNNVKKEKVNLSQIFDLAENENSKEKETPADSTDEEENIDDDNTDKEISSSSIFDDEEVLIDFDNENEDISDDIKVVDDDIDIVDDSDDDFDNFIDDDEYEGMI